MSDIRKTVWQQFTDARLSSDLTCVYVCQVYGVECMELGKLYIFIRNTTYYAVQLCFCYCMSCALEGRRQIWGRHLDSSSQGWLIKMYCVHVCLCLYCRQCVLHRRKASHMAEQQPTHIVYICVCVYTAGSMCCWGETIYTVVHKVGWPPLAKGGSCLIVHLHRVASSWRGLFCYLRRAELVSIKFGRDQN